MDAQSSLPKSVVFSPHEPHVPSESEQCKYKTSRKVRGIMHMCMWRKDNIFRQRRLSIYHVLCIVHYISCIILMHHALVSCIQKFVNPSLHLLKRMVLKTICSCCSHIQRLHYPGFAAFFYFFFISPADLKATKTLIRKTP